MLSKLGFTIYDKDMKEFYSEILNEKIPEREYHPNFRSWNLLYKKRK